MVKSEIYHSDTRPRANFHQPSVNLTNYQQGVYCLDVNMLYSYSKIESDNPKKLKLILQKCLYDMIYLTAIGLTPGGSNTYLHTNNTRTTQSTQNNT